MQIEHQAIIRWLWTILLAMWPTIVQALEVSGTTTVNLAPHVMLLEDPGGSLAREDMDSPAVAARFVPWSSVDSEINLGLTRSVYWLKVTLQRQPDAPRDWIIEIPDAYLAHIHFYAPHVAAIETGNAHPLNSRPIFDRYFAFPVTLLEAPQAFYIRVSSHYSLSVPLLIHTQAQYIADGKKRDIVQSLYYGGFLALVIYNLFLFASLHDRRFLLYSLSTAFTATGVMAGNGVGRLFLWPDAVAFDTIAATLFIALGAGWSVLFSRSIVGISQPRWLDLGLLILFWGYMLAAGGLLLSLWLPDLFQVMFVMLTVIAPMSGALVIVAGIRALRMGLRGARFFLLAWFVMWCGALVAIARAYHWLPTNVLTSYAIQLSSAIEMLLFSLALADIFHHERAKRSKAQAQALAAEQLLTHALKASEERLERAVEQRTEQLRLSVEQKKHTLAQHMRFGALISHEFRNPLSIISSQVSLIRKQHADETDIVSRCTIIDSATQRLQDKFERWLLGDKLNEQLNQLLMTDIPLQSWLSHFAQAHLHLHHNHTLVIDTANSPGSVYADEYLLGIALANLVENACKYSPAGSRVTLTLHARVDAVGIAVSDRGCGIDPTELTNIFRDYYRCNDETHVPGLGLGLSFVSRIMEAHRGYVDVDSTPSLGSTFYLWFPQQDAPAT